MITIKSIYAKSIATLKKKPLKLWGISLLAILLASLAGALTVNIIIVGLAVSLLLQVAMTIIFLNGYRGEEVKTTDLFATFKSWTTIKRVLCGMGWMYLWIFIWGLIPIVGIVFAAIRTYEYRFVPYILVMEPEVGITDALKVSKERTMGYKGKMFWADVLWILLFFAASFVCGLLSPVKYIGWIFVIVNFLLCLAVAIFGELFRGIIHAAFYDEVENIAKSAGSLPESGEKIICPDCGYECEPDQKFCSRCGAALVPIRNSEFGIRNENEESEQKTEEYHDEITDQVENKSEE